VTAAVDFADVSFAYRVGQQSVVPGTDPTTQQAGPIHALKDLALSLAPGSATLITGPSGSGKSTALRLMNGLIPQVTHGDLSGQVHVDGLDVATTPIEVIGRRTATVFQNPRNQFFAATVREELAFARQQAGQPREEILAAVRAAADRVGIGGWLDRSLRSMSGGELQAVACATALAGTGDVYLFDEPTSNLSPRAIDALTQIMREMRTDGATLVVAEHRLYFLRGLVDTVVTMAHGRISRIWEAEEFFASSDQFRREHGWRTLSPPALPPPRPVVSAGPEAVSSAPTTAAPPDQAARNTVAVRDLRFRYGERLVLDIPDLAFPGGTVTALTGDNGAGKSTLCRVLTGLATPRSGSVLFGGTPARGAERRARSFLVMQDVHRQLFAETVLVEVTTGRGHRTDVDPMVLLEKLDLDGFADRHPMSLSGGQKQRLVVASALAADSTLVVFDEPTSGVDYRHMQAVSSLIRDLAARGVAVVVVSHDLEFIADCADRVVRLSAPEAGRPNDVQISDLPRSSHDADPH
jgi:energy-coupling factor transport system ATP-binding protein